MKKKVIKRFLSAGVILLLAILIIPIPGYKPTFSRQIYTSNNELISATVSSEQQWCFPLDEDLPPNLKTSIILYEDEYFRFHPGINPVSVIKSAWLNLKSGKTVRGASTLPMQLMRMKNKNSVRSWRNKIWEALSAVKYSLLHSDDRILKEWCEMAPFGGNTVGIKAAALRYFNRSLDNLTWSEYALLTVMPNGPSTFNLTKNREQLKHKRDFLLSKLCKKGYFDPLELNLFIAEKLPEVVNSIPQEAYHLLLFLNQKHPEQSVFYTTINEEIQRRSGDLLAREASFLQSDNINNVAAVIIDVQKNELLAYHGNIRSPSGSFSYVDVVQAPRSYGSLLKPLLYAYVLEKGQMLPHEMIADIPTNIDGFQPENFDKKFRGAVPLSDMVIQSLNVPAVRVLNNAGLQGFYDEIIKLKLDYLDRGSDRYGLSLILGGGESSLWSLTRLYKGFARNYYGYPYPFDEISVLKNVQKTKPSISLSYSPITINHTVNVMADLTRPREEKSWQFYENEYKIGWKTGTSYGHRDAWSIGFNGKYAIGVWVGNNSGEGRYNLTGISKASPIMFKLFNMLPANEWFPTQPTKAHKESIRICNISGKLAGPLCRPTSTIYIGRSSLLYSPCTWHKEVFLDKEDKMLPRSCSEYAVKKDTFFVLPPYLEYFYKESHFDYQLLPEKSPLCLDDNETIKIIYPTENVKIFLPRTGEKNQNHVIMKSYHRDAKTTLYWFVNDVYLGTTHGDKHEMSYLAGPGSYTLYVTDSDGNSDSVHFEILE